MRTAVLLLACAALLRCGSSSDDSGPGIPAGGKSDEIHRDHSAAGIRYAFRSALADGIVDSAEASSITSALMEDSLSPSEEGQLRTLVEYNQALMAPEASQHFQSFIANELAKVRVQSIATGNGSRGSIDDPDMLNKHKNSYAYRGLQGKLFIDGITGSDVLQGHIADCYLVAALSAIAHAHPETIEKAFRANEDGTVTVTLYSQPYFGADLEPYEFTVDTDFVMETDTTPLYGRSPDTDELWVALLEKALVMLKAMQSELSQPNYESIGYGDLAGKIITAVTGNDYSSVVMEKASAATIFERVDRATQSGKAVAFRTYQSGRRVYTEPRVHNDHSYSLLGTVVLDGAKYLRLRNPWGFDEPGEDGKNDGIFLMTPEKAKDIFMSAFIED